MVLVQPEFDDVVVVGAANEGGDSGDQGFAVPIDGSSEGRAGFRLPKSHNVDGKVILVHPEVEVDDEVYIDAEGRIIDGPVDAVVVGAAEDDGNDRGFAVPVDGSSEGRAGFRLPKAHNVEGKTIVVRPDVPFDDEVVILPAASARPGQRDAIPVDGSSEGRAGFRLPKAMNVDGKVILVHPEVEIDDEVIIDAEGRVVESPRGFRFPVDGSEEGRAGFRLPKPTGREGEVLIGKTKRERSFGII